MESLAIFGLVVGMRHALEADHLSAVASLIANGASGRGAVALGALWGLGHTATLLVVGGSVLVSGTQLPPVWSPLFELLVGLMLLALGVDVLRRHLARHSGAKPAACEQVPRARAFAVGIVHGLAGSAALMLLVASSAATPGQGFLDLALFGIGSIGGMALLSLILSLSLHYASARARVLGRGFVVVVGLTTVAVGAGLAFQHSTQVSWSH